MELLENGARLLSIYYPILEDVQMRNCVRGYKEESYLSMIAERIQELKKLKLEFQNSLWV